MNRLLPTILRKWSFSNKCLLYLTFLKLNKSLNTSVWFCLDLVLRECLYSDETLRQESAIKGVKMEKQMLITKTYEASHKPAQWDCLFKHQTFNDKM